MSNDTDDSISPLPITTEPKTNPNPSQHLKRLPKRFVKNQIPDSILSNPALNAAISLLPSNYNFEVHKTLHRISSSSARRVALQFPDGLLMYSLPLADIFRSFSSTTDVLVLAEPTYGACCLDDYAASALSADLLVHYGHSCLVPVPSSLLPVLYVFVDIRIDVPRLAATVQSALAPPRCLALAGTVQFVGAVHAARSLLEAEGFNVVVPQAKPLSPGEVLGCTAPTMPKSYGVDVVVFVADGRFHLEAFMIANPGIPAYRYDPYLGVLVLEEYDHEGMKKARKDAIFAAREARNWGIVLGTLGRQGNTKVLDRVVDKMEEKGLDWTVVLMSEISPGRMELFRDSVDAWVQIACPRLSIDWGEGFSKPMLTTFELDIALGIIPGWWEKDRRAGARNTMHCQQGCRKKQTCSGTGCCQSSDSCCGSADEGTDYPMDYYALDGGDWNSSYVKRKTATIEVKLCN
ncbi:2-(3-amino-3-carboxypropyl)histidine synthase subunit 1 [Phalaenopsis equestris]|uniref:2-(3-amino-3-carboxypropyl)histidine synthase subunit 1 n=1 Tax=Phalaenopsis equestris TaxID=78828 RepID=UPI0009E5E77B|nr:2-(3-amino-3-carboxypropyl)histidine synthase subunit 1 [Phalaenopsis equestris]